MIKSKRCTMKITDTPNPQFFHYIVNFAVLIEDIIFKTLKSRVKNSMLISEIQTKP